MRVDYRVYPVENPPPGIPNRESDWLPILTDIDIRNGVEGEMRGIVAGAQARVWYHKVKLVVLAEMVEIDAGFIDDLPFAGILGRADFLQHFVVTFSHEYQPPGMEIARIRRA